MCSNFILLYKSMYSFLWIFYTRVGRKVNLVLIIVVSNFIDDIINFCMNKDKDVIMNKNLYFVFFF